MTTRGAVFLALLTALPAAAGAQPAPPPVSQIGVDEKVGARVARGLRFTEASGRPVGLADYLDGERPVFLVLAYVRCAMLCSLVLRGAADAVQKLERVPGDEYRVLTVSIDPKEPQAAAAAKRKELLDRIGYPGEPERWPYLLGEETSVRTLAQSLGFRYAWDPRTQQYAHPAVAFVLAPDGTVARYLHGIHFPADELSAALDAAAAGGAAPPSPSYDSSVLSCFRFGPALRKYRETIRVYFRAGALALFAILSSLVVGLFLWERKRSAGSRRLRKRS